jgi:site-specific DNA-methyltransferase (adenine-specific)
MLSRMKFKIEPLVAEILDQLPQTVWASPTTTFFDPAIGGGQFVREIERRLRAQGHSDANIRNRVFGFENSELHIRFAVNKYNLVGKYVRNPYAKFFELDNTMKFDVIVGNPPYQTGKGEKGGKHSLWRKFVKQAFSLVKKDGFVSIVCPGFPYDSNDLRDCFTKNTPIVLCNDATSHFPGVGSEVKYWIVKEGKHNIPFIVDGTIWHGGLANDPTVTPIVISILNKIKNLPVFECKQDKGYNSTQYKNDNNDYFDSPSGASIFPIRHASTIKVCYVSKPTASHYKNKVMMTFSGYPDFEYYDGKTTPMSSCYQMSGYIEVKNKKQGQALIEIYKSKFYTFLSGIKSAGMKGTGNYTLPQLDLTKAWTDSEIYKHFGLTQEEIDYVEANVK